MFIISEWIEKQLSEKNANGDTGKRIEKKSTGENAKWGNIN